MDAHRKEISESRGRLVQDPNRKSWFEDDRVPRIRQAQTGRHTWVPNSATWNGSFGAPDSAPGVLDNPFVPEREMGEFLCSECFLIHPNHQMSTTQGVCSNCESELN